MKRVLTGTRARTMTIMTSVIFATCLLPGDRAYAIAMYDYLSDATMTFNQPWSSYAAISTSTTSGSGQYTASTMPSQDADPQDFSYYQSARIVGSAGDASLSQGGTSHAYNLVETFITFEFAVQTDLVVSLTDWNQILLSSRQLPLWEPANQTGEYIGFWPELGGGGTGLQLALDGQFFAIPNWDRGGSTTFDNLIGTHTILLKTSADESALAGYPYIRVPEPPTLLLLAAGLGVLTGIARRMRRRP